MKKLCKKLVMSLLALSMMFNLVFSAQIASAACSHSTLYPSYNGMVHISYAYSSHPTTVWVYNHNGVREAISATCNDTTATEYHQWLYKCANCNVTQYDRTEERRQKTEHVISYN